MKGIKFAFLMAAILILNESLAETISILSIGEGADWIAIKDIGLLLMDLLIGMTIIYIIFWGNSDFTKGIGLATILSAIVLHFGRAIEYIFSPEIAYCYYPGMFWMNNLILILLLVTLGLAYLFQALKINLNHL